MSKMVYRLGTAKEVDRDIDVLSRPRAFHTKRDCEQLQKYDDWRIIETPREKAESRGFGLCAYCEGTNERAKFGGATCPLCKAELSVKVPTHLRSGECEAQ